MYLWHKIVIVYEIFRPNISLYKIMLLHKLLLHIFIPLLTNRPYKLTETNTKLQP